VKFYLGTHEQRWLWDDRLRGVPLFVSHRRLQRRKSTYPRAVTSWALDSGGFTELSTYGRWATGVQEYVEAARRYRDELGGMDWAAPQDWMCEPWITAKTGLAVEEHQRRTVESLLTLRSAAPDVPWIPVLQGWDAGDYDRCVGFYRDAGVDLWAEPVVGVGSVCRRQATSEIVGIVGQLASSGLGLHGFGVKADGLRSYSWALASADSMAWSFAGRRRPDPTHPHVRCNNCLDYALDWRDRVLASHPQEPQLPLTATARKASGLSTPSPAALDAEDGDGLAEIARISADADLYRKTDGVVIRREDGSA